MSGLDDGTRISEEVEKFLRSARGKNVEVCSAMLKQNPKLVNSVEAGGFGALHFAAFNGDLDLINVLLPYKPDLELKNYDGNTPMMMAAKVRQEASIKALVDAGASVNYESATGATAAHFAASMGDVSTVRYLKSLGAKTLHEGSATGSILHWAAHSGDIKCVGAMLYEFNIPIDIKDAHGGTALFTALFTKKNEVVQFLLEQGADCQTCIEGDLSTPLHIAVEHSELENVKALMAFGANPHAVNKDGDTPLTLAEKKNLKGAMAELTKQRLPAENRAEEAARLKAHGNKVFIAGENVKAAKFYTLAIQLDPKNHVNFSNRAACYFNQRYFPGAFYDACRCVALAPKWAKGYFRKAATLHAMKNDEDAIRVLTEGLKLDSKNPELLTLQLEINKGK